MIPVGFWGAPMIDDLSRLAILNGTDKFGLHDYTPVYYDLLKDLRDRPLRMLEIGVGGYGHPDRGGESLAAWRDFFPNALVVGLDIQPKTMDLGPRVKILQGSQVDAAFLTNVVRDHGPFDVILDDGSHMNAHVVETFGLLFPTLAPGGIYIVEDVQTVTFPKYGGSLTLEQPNMVGFFAGMAEDLFKGGDVGEVAAIERFHNIIVIHKRDADGQGPSADSQRHVMRAKDAGLPLPVATAEVLGDAGAAAAVIQSCGMGGVATIAPSTDNVPLLQELFLHMDHREIRVHFPDAHLHPFAKSLASMAVYPGTVLFVGGDNDYPSNFAFERTHPRVVAAVAQMTEVIKDERATANGILMYLTVLKTIGQAPVDDDFVDRLTALKSTDRRYFQMALAKAMSRNDWAEAVRLGREGLGHYSDDPQLTAHLARGLRFTDGLDAAHDFLESAYRKSPRAAPILNGLASLKIAKGDVDGGIELHEKCIELAKPHTRAKGLQSLLKICTTRHRDQASRRIAEKLLTYAPDDPEALAVMRAAADHHEGWQTAASDPS